MLSYLILIKQQRIVFCMVNVEGTQVTSESKEGILCGLHK
jgi:hypothetical protein